MIPTRLSAFASDHGLPQERFYNLICLAFGANHVGFADLEKYLPPTRSPRCQFEYRTLVRAFDKEITPHIDQETAKRVLDTNWLQRLNPNQSLGSRAMVAFVLARPSQKDLFCFAAAPLIGPELTSRDVHDVVAIGRKADVTRTSAKDRL